MLDTTVLCISERLRVGVDDDQLACHPQASGGVPERLELPRHVAKPAPDMEAHHKCTAHASGRQSGAHNPKVVRTIPNGDSDLQDRIVTGNKCVVHGIGHRQMTCRKGGASFHLVGIPNRKPSAWSRVCTSTKGTDSSCIAQVGSVI